MKQITIRDALSWTIAGSALPDLSEQAVVEWLNKQGLEDPRPETVNDSAYAILSAAVHNYRYQLLPEAFQVDSISSSLQNPEAKWFGKGRSGAGWNEGAAFCISSAFVRLLGALEQFEIDVLKSLFYYRPSGMPLGHHTDQIVVTVEMDVVTEEPEKKGNVYYYKKPAIWTWVKPLAEGNDKRRQIFKRVYELELTPGKSDAERKPKNILRKKWYEQRNKIAHGREGVTITLKEYLDVDAYVTKSMMYLATQCMENQKLII